MLLVAGGSEDPNLECMLRAAASLGVASLGVRTVAQSSSCLSWDLATDRLTVDRKEIKPSAVFIRHDAFAGLADPRAEVERRALSWFVTVQGWTMAHAEVGLLNRGASIDSSNKPYTLALAKACGLTVPQTVITNDLERMAAAVEGHALIVKPVAGGDYCQTAKEALQAAAGHGPIGSSPAIAQERLVAPEVRVYVVGHKVYPFRVQSDALDYRTDDGTELVPITPESLPDGLVNGLLRLTQTLRMDFGAADFKTRESTDELCFLEINNQPMIAAFDAKLRGDLARAIVVHLMNRHSMLAPATPDCGCGS